MFKLANQVLDAHDDIERVHLKKLAKINPQVNMITEEERNALPDREFGICFITKKASRLNKFPIESKDSTWLSNQYFNETHYNMPKEAAEIAAGFIKKACEKFGITPTAAVASMAKTASSNVYYEKDIAASAKVNRTNDVDLSKFAEVSKIGDSYTHAQYVFASPTHVKLGNAYFDQYSDKMPVIDRHKYAAALQRRAGELGMTLTGKISKYASNAYGAHVNAHLSSRRALLNDQTFVTALDKMAAMKDTMAPMDFANLLHGFDKRAGLNKYYDGYLVNPFAATFAGQHNPKALYKSASYGSITADGISKLATEKYAKIKEYFGVSIADSLKKEGAPAFDALPNDAKEIIAGIADGSL